MLKFAVLLALGQTCNGTSCSRPSAPAAVQYSAAPSYVAREAPRAFSAPAACSVQPVATGRRKAGFRPFGKLFGGRRGGCG